MRNETTDKGLSATLAGVAVLALTLGFMGGCGDDETNLPDDSTPDAGNNTPDGGNNGTPDAGPSNDTDLAVVRFNANGTLDTGFGTNGIAKVDLGAGNANARDAVWGMTRDSSDRLVLFGNRKGSVDRSDVDQVVVRLTANGALDTAFGTDGVYALNIGNLNENARHGFVQADGKIVSSGYIPQPTGVGAQSANRILLTRLNDDGKLDTTFGSKGVVNSAPFVPADFANTEWGMTEAYSVAPQGGKYITTGYGRTAPSGTVDLVSFRYTADGKLDTTWGNNGTFLLDLVGDNDRGRDLVVLPDERVFMVGSGTPVAQKIAGMTVMLTPSGARDTNFTADGYKLYDFGRPEQAFFDVAVSPTGDRVAAAGYVTGASQDDDATLLLMPIGSGTAAEFAQPVPLSDAGNDRFWGVAFDASGKAYGAGFLTESGDNRMVVARFNTDGTRDTTFGNGGLVTVNVATAGTVETARAVVVQSDGKVVIAGVVEKQ